MKIHKWIILKNENYPYCQPNSERRCAMSISWEKVTCKKCLRKRKNIRRVVRQNGAEQMDKDKDFVEGVLWAAQFLTVSHGENSLAENLMLESGMTEKQFTKAQRKSGYESREMMPIIRKTFAV